jgi:hypothetical protein
MKLINRGYLIIKQKQPFWDWANSVDPEMEFNEEDQMEPNIYLIAEDFFEEDSLIESYYKKIFQAELMAVTEDKDIWPREINLALFENWFSTIAIGSTVIDLEKGNIQSFDF